MISSALRERAEPWDAEQLLRDALASANGAVIDVPWMPRSGRDGPSCTIVAAVWDGTAITVTWSGDSRAYWVDDAVAVQLTSDHSWAQTQIDTGRVDEHKALCDPRAHAITRWLGPDAPPEAPPVAVFRPRARGRLIVCSDGLWNYLTSTAELASIVSGPARGTPPIDIARALTRHALACGGSDNVTVVVIDVTPESHGTHDTEEQTP
jgi:serine/threonine protein phosphatase PrpC